MESLDALVICAFDFFMPSFIVVLLPLALREGSPDTFFAADAFLQEFFVLFKCNDEATIFPF